MTTDRYSVLILGAAYGSLVGTKLALAGHAVTLVCTRPTADLINQEGTMVRLPVRDRKTPIEISSKAIGADLCACTPSEVEPRRFDLVVLGMQEPQYSAAGVRELMARLAAARVPCLAIMNMPPSPFLTRIGLSLQGQNLCYTDPSLWKDFEPGLITVASPDPQAFRPAGEGNNVLEVGLATNFKAAPFEADAHTAILRRLERDIEAIRFDPGGGAIELPVKLKVHDSLFVPLAKWPMLLTGNYRCVRPNSVTSIKQAVDAHLDKSRAVYDWVAELCRRLGARESDLVPFDKYAQAAQKLDKPSSVARALASGAKRIERVDLLVRQIAAERGLRYEPVDEIVAFVNYRLQTNREPIHFEHPISFYPQET